MINSEVTMSLRRQVAPQSLPKFVVKMPAVARTLVRGGVGQRTQRRQAGAGSRLLSLWRFRLVRKALICGFVWSPVRMCALGVRP